jgi:glucose/mannose-6-phosphate isomerase
MAARIDAIPEQVLAAVDAGVSEPWRLPIAAPDLLAVGALGGSAITADLSASLHAARLPRPLIVVRDYEWPACVGPRSLALLASYSGNTEETLALYDQAGIRGIPRIALTTGGALAERCARDRVAWVRLPPGSPPRAAMYASWVNLTRLLHALGWIDDPAPEWRATAVALMERRAAWGTRVPESHNPAKQMARELHGRPLFIYGASSHHAALATRIRNQFNENAKLLCHSAVVPELNHNEIVGWELPAAWTKDAAMLMLRDPQNSHEARVRLTLTAEYVARQGATVFVLEDREGTLMQRTAALAQFADYLSLYLALLSGVDPTPIVSIDWFKSRLAESQSGQ